tara:strand:- start:153 stop:386 length:234 start_codon:yes stop_codon:yes gene_type:complete
MTNKIVNLEAVKDWFTLVAAIVTCVAAIIFWIQTSSDTKFDNLQSQVDTLRSDIKSIEKSNNEILRIIGRLEGQIDN